MNNIQEQALYYLQTYGWKIAAGLIVFILGLWVSKLIRRTFQKGTERSGMDVTLAKFFSDLLYSFLIIIVIIIALGSIGIKTASLIAVLGAATLAIGLALQGNLSNLAAGVMLIMTRPFSVDDFVEVSGQMGTVEKIALFGTTLKSPDGRRIVCPNNTVMNSNIINFTANPTRRLEIPVGIAYNSDIKLAKTVLLKIMADDERIHDEPAPHIGVTGLGASSVDLVIRPWVDKEHFLDAQFDLYEKIKEEFDKAGIEIPFPQRVVTMVKED